MRTAGSIDFDAAQRQLARRLLERRAAPDHWDGHLSSSALSTATAMLALHLVTAAARAGKAAADARLQQSVAAGVRWLIAHQNDDGGWGDTIRSKSNISTTAIVWASLSAVSERCRELSDRPRGRVARARSRRLHA